jgi:nitrogen regulatory protein PII
MNYIVLLVLHDLDKVSQVLSAWEAIGVSGVTVIPSTGLGRIREKFTLREDMPLIPSLSDILSDPHEELTNRTIFSIVENEEFVDKIIEATENILGDMYVPRTGIIAVIPLARIHGLNRNWKTDKHAE